MPFPKPERKKYLKSGWQVFLRLSEGNAQQCGKKWRALPQSEKDKYKAMAAKEEEGKDHKAPKSKCPTSAWQYFQGDMLKEGAKKGKQPNETLKKCGQMWPELSRSWKLMYQRMAKDDKERVETEKAEYKAWKEKEKELNNLRKENKKLRKENKKLKVKVKVKVKQQEAIIKKGQKRPRDSTVLSTPLCNKVFMFKPWHEYKRFKTIKAAEEWVAANPEYGV